MEEKYQKLKEYISGLKKVAVAYSAGVDSTFLLKTAVDALGADNVLAVTVISDVMPSDELEEAKNFCQSLGVSHQTVFFDALKMKEFVSNPPDRCYYCKKSIFTLILSVAEKLGFGLVLEGTNADDTFDYRPGVKALKELGILSPLKDFSLTKREIRALSERLGLKTHSKPSNACLATRIAYGERVTREKLEKIEKAERFIRSLGFTQVRVRLQGGSARIELSPDELPMIFRSEVFERVKDYLNGLSFDYVSIDMNGYKSGNMNKAIKR